MTTQKPLSYRLSPKSLQEYVGQKHIVGEGKLLRRMIEADRIFSIIFYGPPGCGKSALAKVIACHTNSEVVKISPLTCSVNELRAILQEATMRLKLQRKKTILLIEEIHRFNKPIQDVLLPHVEEGNISLIGITTLNPYFAISSPLISRSTIFEFTPLSEEEIKIIIERALKDEDLGLHDKKIKIGEEEIKLLAKLSDGDARRALNALEIAILTTPPHNSCISITKEVIEESIQKKAIVYDRAGDAHYDTISAFIKSMRGSSPDATIYYLAKMLYAGEDIRYIARRMIIFAAEDVGLADPNALVIANSCYDAIEKVGLPEAELILAEVAIYLSLAPKSNSSYVAFNKAKEKIKKDKTIPIPDHLKDAHYKGAKALGRGINYKYPHDFPNAYVEQIYLPTQEKFYTPKSEYEKKLKRNYAI